MAKPSIVVLVWYVALGLQILLGETHAGGLPLSKESAEAKTFWVIHESQAGAKSSGMLMGCPAHKHGTPDEAFERLEDILKARPSHQLSSIWVCRANQTEILKRFAPLIDQVFINPFVHLSDQGPASEDFMWPNFKHPVVNRLREIRANGGEKRLLACVNLRGETSLFGKRPASFEEIEWMIFATIGANFQGLVWRGNLNRIPWARRLRRFADNLKRYADDLGTARPVGWVKPIGSQPVSAICSEKTLFVVLLNPHYMTLDRQQAVRLPLKLSAAQDAEVEISPPEGVTITSVESLGSRAPRLYRDRNHIRARCRFAGGGQMLVFHLSHGSGSKPNRTSPNTMKLRKEHEP